MRLIACTVNMFDLNSPVLAVDTETQKTQFLHMEENNKLPERLIYWCNKSGIDHVCLYGAKSYLAPIKTKIEETGAINKYGKKITVEIRDKM